MKNLLIILLVVSPFLMCDCRKPLNVTDFYGNWMFLEYSYDGINLSKKEMKSHLELLGIKKRNQGFYLKTDSTGTYEFSAYGSVTSAGEFKIDLANDQVVFTANDDQPIKVVDVLYLDEHFMQIKFTDEKDHIYIYSKRK